MVNSTLIMILIFLLGILSCWVMMTFLGLGKRSLQIMKQRYQKLDASFEDLEKSFQKQDSVARTERKGLLDRIKVQNQSIKDLNEEKSNLIIDAQTTETTFLSQVTNLNNQIELLNADKDNLKGKNDLQAQEIVKLAEEVEMAKSRGAVAQSSDAEMKMLQHSMTRLREMMEQEGEEYRKQIAKLTQQLEAALQNKPVFDDLTQISGVGNKLQELLNSIGVSSFQHIAEATPETMDKMKSILGNFSDRIERDEWIDQAKKLMS